MERWEMDPTPEDRRRFEGLVDLVYEPLQRYALRRCDPHTAEDVVADTLLVLWRRLDQVPADEPLPWTYRVAANCLANARRAQGRRVRLADKVARLDPPRTVELVEAPDPALHAALASLAPDDREVLGLWAWEQLSPAEIAVAMGTSANAASIRLHRAKRRLGTAIGKVHPPVGHKVHDDREEVT